MQVQYSTEAVECYDSLYVHDSTACTCGVCCGYKVIKISANLFIGFLAYSVSLIRHQRTEMGTNTTERQTQDLQILGKKSCVQAVLVDIVATASHCSCMYCTWALGLVHPVTAMKHGQAVF